MKNQMNLNEMGLNSLSHNEMKETNGGFFWFVFAGVAILGTLWLILRDKP